MSCRRSLGSYYPIKESKSFTEKNWGISQSYFPVQEQVLSNSGDIEYIDEVIDDDEMMEYMKDESQLKGRRGVLRITGEDKRPKCQPIGAQIDCRFGVKVGKLKIELNNIFFQMWSITKSSSWRVVCPVEVRRYSGGRYHWKVGVCKLVLEFLTTFF